MKAIPGILLLILACLASVASASEKIVEVKRDSIADFANVLFVASDSLVNEDSVYCDKIVLAGETDIGSKDPRKVSFFTCGDKRVSEFTFAGYDGAYAKFLYKPEGADQEYFGKARIPIDALHKVFAYQDQDTRKKKGKDHSAGRARAASLFYTFTVVALVVFLIYYYGNG